MLDELILHIGLHKTATTHFQDWLAKERAGLRLQGLEYIPRHEFRTARIQSSLLKPPRFSFSNLLDRSKIDRLGNGAKRLMISEENLLGLALDLLVVPPYPYLELRLSHLAAIIPRKIDLKILISIRNIGSILPSAYCQSLRGGRILKDYAHYEKIMLEHPPRWSALALRVRAIFPNAQFKFWTQEEYRNNAREIIEEVTGCHLTGTEPARPDETGRISNMAVTEILKLDAALPNNVREREVQRIIGMSKGDPLFDPQSAESRQIFSSIYVEELAKLREAFPGSLLSFGSFPDSH